ncbi:MAG: cysteine--tRNA ligase, partial [Bacillota bacterium]|nr:cysteine--tRNA ligase [Bacillota bacterium]
MAITVYNTLSRQKEELVTRDPGQVAIYVCGVTPYDYTHVGHARVSVLWDVFRRYLAYRGYKVKFVQNFTDVEDKIIRRAQEEGTSPAEVAERFIADYFAGMEALGVAPADYHPRVSEEIPWIVELIRVLVEKGYAYAAGGDVLYDVRRFPAYGRLSGRTPAEMEAGARVEVNPNKRYPMDFALWKAAKPGEPAWESPWGPGRPGWHIECSAMALKYLGFGLDIHGGGIDLIFPHHENEIAQSEAYAGSSPFVRYWMHNGLVTVAEEKMSKSLGNTAALRDVLREWPPVVVRFFLLSTHYRSPLTFAPAELEAARKGWERLDGVLQRVRAARREVRALQGGEGDGEEGAGRPLERAVEPVWEEARRRFVQAMDDDFNTALAIATLHDLAREVNRFLDERQGAVSLSALEKIEGVFLELGEILNIFPPEAGPKAAGGCGDHLTEGLIDLLLAVRQKARERRDWATAD